MISLFGKLMGKRLDMPSIKDFEKYFQKANELSRLNRLEEALTNYDNALAINPNHAGAHCKRGSTLQRLNRLKDALESYDKALVIDTDCADAHYNRGTVMQLYGRSNDAIACFSKSLEINHNDQDAYINLGLLLVGQKSYEEAGECFDKAIAINSNNVDANFYRGNTFQELNLFEEALVCYDKAICLQADLVAAFYNRGIALANIKRMDDALASYDRAIALNPANVEAYNKRGAAFVELQRPDRALASYDKALELNPNFAEAHYNRGNALIDLKRLDDAVACYGRAVFLKPDYVEAYSNKGAALMELNRWEEALVCFDKAITLKPDYAEAYVNQGSTLKTLKRLEEALGCFDKAIDIKNDYAEAYWNKSLLLISAGEYREGWQLYEWRFNVENLKNNYHTFQILDWRGQENIQGKRLLVYSEQGVGDVVQFCRYITQVKTLGAEIIFEVDKSLVPLISTLNCPMSIVVKGSEIPKIDAYCPIMSLPYAFKTTVETIPAEVPYLFSDKHKVQQWHQKLGNKEGVRVGLVWSGSSLHKNDLNRSIRLEDLLLLTDLPVEWHSMQKEYRKHDLEILKQHPEILQHQEKLNDFSDTAALIECMDLVISVDTSVAHVAGALGKPVWILLPFAADYRWMQDREDSPWYPSARLFRQSVIGDWQSVVARVAAELQTMIRFI